MKILIITAGSRGDVQPYVALGKGLKKAGHVVTVCTCSGFEKLITGHGLNYGYMNNDFIELVESAAGRKAMEGGGSTFGLVKTMIALLKRSKSLIRGMLRDSWDAAQAARPDAIIFHPKGMGGAYIAEKLGVPALLATPVPLLVPTAEFVAVGIPDLRLGGWFNRLSYAAVHRGYRMYGGVVNEFRREVLGLGKLPRSASPIRMADGRPLTVLHGHSRFIWPRPDDWPETAHVTGCWFLDHPEGWRPPAELSAFLEAGEAPVYVGFGSMAGRDPGRKARLVVEALRKANVRGVIATGRGGLDASDLPDTVFKLDDVPHDWLFPRVSAVVHHGGAGTTAAGLRAGRPTVICPYVIDQPLWGERVYALGAGSKPIPQKRLTAENLAEAIREATTSQDIRRNAEGLGKRIREEDGIANAVSIIESVAQSW
ncbi:MAG: glycosyltransferase [Acidobacteria bacterium]|nr:glycosyltransferase [Acidobacteriota bacterium]